MQEANESQVVQAGTVQPFPVQLQFCPAFVSRLTGPLFNLEKCGAHLSVPRDIGIIPAQADFFLEENSVGLVPERIELRRIIIDTVHGPHGKCHIRNADMTQPCKCKCFTACA